VTGSALKGLPEKARRGVYQKEYNEGEKHSLLTFVERGREANNQTQNYHKEGKQKKKKTQGGTQKKNEFMGK